MGHSTVRVYVHIVFHVKCWRPDLLPHLRPGLYNHIYRFVERYYPRCRVIEVNAVPDHIHLLVRLDSMTALGAFVRDLKSSSSRYMNKFTVGKIRFAWRAGYGGFSCPYKALGPVRRYIVRQQVHHRKESTKEEYIRLLQEHGIQQSDLHPNDRI